jgi:DNA-binding XRE family transcriptional regulator
MSELRGGVTGFFAEFYLIQIFGLLTVSFIVLFNWFFQLSQTDFTFFASQLRYVYKFNSQCRLLSVVQQSTLQQLYIIMDIQHKYGIKVKKFRINKGWSQEKLALNADLDRTYIPSIEKGKRNVSIVVIEKIAIALDVDIKDFFNSNSEIK